MEFTSNPLDGELFEQQDGRADEEGEQKFAHYVDRTSRVITNVALLSSINEGVEADPVYQCPCE